MSKVSILIAVYNAEKHLHVCLDSVRAQTMRDIQIVCIDDCSTDGSLSILQDYATMDDRIVLIRLDENRGQAIARNEGLRVADGDYIMMLDSDDWLAEDAVEKAYRAINDNDEIDCALLRLTLFYEDTGLMEVYKNRTEDNSFTGEEAFLLALDWSLHGLYLIRSSIHKAYPYDTTCRLYSDDNTTLMHYLHSRSVVLSDGVYYYRKHSDSMTMRVSLLRFEYMSANLSLKNMILDEIDKGLLSNPETVLNKYEVHRWLNIVDAYWLYYSHKRSFTPAERKEITSRIAYHLQTIERRRIPMRLRLKFGYYPFKSYKLFSFVENLYFGLRNVLKYKQ